MNHQVLARKWRPKTFSQVVGQQHILPALIHALEQKRLHHAYLFTGTRGVGKTTIARIFAKCLNCEEGVSATPCGNCPACLEISTGKFIDLIEVDAASRTKVEDTRDLLDNVQYAPTRGRYKIYLIDEVHMLSNHSFNALLKTLEEPPEHVIFLLATTDPQKLPITVLSRCLQLHLRALPREQLSEYCADICKQEKVNADVAALQVIAEAAQGSVRDALSLLDQAIAYSDGNISEKTVCDMLGNVRQDALWQLLAAVAAKDLDALLQISHNMAMENVDFTLLLQQLLEKFHDIAIAQFSEKAITQHPDKIATLAKQFSKEACQIAYQTVLIGQKDIGLAPSEKMGFDMILLRLVHFTSTSSHIEASSAASTTASKPSTPVTSPTKTNTATPQASVAKPSQPTNNWQQVLANLNLNGMAQLVAANCSLLSFSKSELSLLLDEVHSPLLSSNVKERIQQAIHKYYGEQVKLTIKLGNQTNLTPAVAKQQQVEAQQQSAEQSINQDEHVQSILDTFNAAMDETSIKPRDNAITDDNK